MNSPMPLYQQTPPSPSVELEVTHLKLSSPAELAPKESSTTPPAWTICQTLDIKLTKPQTLITPSVLECLSLPAELDFAQSIVLFGQAPIWLYSHLISQCLETSAHIPWIGTYDARGQQVVIVASATEGIAVGDTFSVFLNREPCSAILIGGPPDSGKSVFSNALRLALRQRFPHKTTYLHRASWDGEGNWAYEAGDSDTGKPELIKRLITLNEFRIHEDPETAKLIPGYFQYHARTVENLRQLTDYLIIDVGGLPQVEKQPLVEKCTHYIVISRLADAVEAWHQLCGHTLSPLAIIHSVLRSQQDIIQTDPLEMVAGPWVTPQNAIIPPALLQHIDTL